MNTAMDAWKKLSNQKSKLRALKNVKKYCDKHLVRMGDYARDELHRLQKEYGA